MKQYNIYAGLKNGFGGAQYQFTDLCENKDEAENEAYAIACGEYDSYQELHGLYSWEDAQRDFCNENGIDPENCDENSFDAIQEYYEDAREEWLDYYVISTDEDDIDQEDLIIGYLIDNGNSSQTTSE
jgi:hypothetical protein